MAKKKATTKTTRKKAAAKRAAITPAHAERMAKRAARRQRIKIELSRAQLDALTKQWKKIKPAEAAELIFTDGSSPTSLIKVAGYSYHGNTCCV